MKTIHVLLEVEYTDTKPDSLDLARWIETHFTDYDKGMRTYVRVISDDRNDRRGQVARR
jgi:hypothetical protein